MSIYSFFQSISENQKLNAGVGGSDPLEVGLRQAKLILDLYPVGKPNPSRVCDFGCGIGRSIPVLSIWWPGAKFAGVDISRDFLAFCEKQDALRSVDLYHLEDDVEHYNDFNSLSVSENVRKFDPVSLAKQFDFLYSYSVLTHLNVAEAERYFKNIGQVLAVGGTAMISCFILDDQSRHSIDDNLSPAFVFGTKCDDLEWFDAVPAQPGAFTAFSLKQLGKMIAANNLVLRTLECGSWRGKGGISLHDMILLEKV
jgi:SAM-dependent methyltransferase